MTGVGSSAHRPGAVSMRFVTLFTVRVTHGYYNAGGGLCPDFTIVPTPDCAATMQQLGIICRVQPTGWVIAIEAARVPMLCTWLGIAGMAPTASDGPWSRLCFLLQPTNPGFIGITQLPITTSPARHNLYGSNLTASRAGTLTIDLSAPDINREDAASSLIAVTGANLAVTTPESATASLNDLSGKPAAVATTIDNGVTRFSLGQLAYGRYTVVIDGAGGDRTDYLYVPDKPPLSLCLIDLLLTWPGHDNDTETPDSRFPVSASGDINPVAIDITFQARETYWHYYVVTRGQAPGAAPDLNITGTSTTFTRSRAHLPNGDLAVLFSATTPLAMRQRSPNRFTLSGQRHGINGSRDDINIDWLPAPGQTPVWPTSQTDLITGTSEMFVYV